MTHLFLPLQKIATGKVQTQSFPRSKPPETEMNLTQRQRHAQKLQAELENLQSAQPLEAKSASQADVSAPMPFLIRSEPSLQQKDQLKSCGLEVVTTLQDNYAVVAAQDLSQLQDKITLFLDASRGGGKVAGIWEILDGTERLQYILSPSLLKQWETLDDERTYTIDVGVACLGGETQLPSPPQQRLGETDERYLKRFDRWQKTCEQQRWQWQVVREERLESLRQFIQRFQGNITSLVQGRVVGAADLADSFTVRIALTGAGLRELALNYPYVFEIKDVPITKQAVHSLQDNDGIAYVAIAPDHFAPNALQEITQGKSHRLFWIQKSSQDHSTHYRAHLSAGAAAIDQLTWESDRLFVVSAPEGTGELAQSLMALTVGDGTKSVSSLWGSIKPDVVTGQSGDEVQEVFAMLRDTLPDDGCLLYRAAIAYTAQWPQWEPSPRLTQAEILHRFGYGVPDVSRLWADESKSARYATQGDQWIKPLQADVYQVQLPATFLAQSPETQVRISVVLSYKAQPHRTEQGRSRYLSTWLDWRCSRPGEPKLSFLGRVMQDVEAPEAGEEVKGSFKWAIGNRKRRDRATGKPIHLSRSDSTLQKDWTVAKLADFERGLYVVVTGHRGWNSDAEASVPYALLVCLDVTA